MTSFKKNKTKKMILLANLAAVAIVLGIIESRLELVAVPGAKLGLANLVSLVVLYLFSYKEALTITVVRIFMVGILSGVLGAQFVMGLSGGILSITMMAIFKKLKFSTTLVSLLGSISHQTGQILAGIFLIGAKEIVMYLYIMIPIGVVTGFIIGVIAERFLVHYNNNLETK